LAGVFPRDFLHILEVAEEGGRVTESLRHQADFYQEEAGRRMTILTMAAGACVWVTVAILIIIVIFRIALTYIGMLDPSKYGLCPPWQAIRSCGRRSTRQSSASAREGSPSAPSWSSTAALLVAVTTAASSGTARSCTRRWTAWKPRAGSVRETTSDRSC